MLEQAGLRLSERSIARSRSSSRLYSAELFYQPELISDLRLSEATPRASPATPGTLKLYLCSQSSPPLSQRETGIGTVTETDTAYERSHIG